MSGYDILQLTTNIAFVAAAVFAIRLWSRHRSSSAAWMASSLGALGLVVLYSQIASWFMDDINDDPSLWFVIPLIVVLLASPYMLWRFSNELAPMSPLMDRSLRVAFVVAVLAVFTPGVLDADPDAPRSAATVVVTIAIIGYWAVANIHAGFNLWRASRTRPGMVSRRLQTLAVATVLLALTLVVSTFGSQGDADPTAVDFASALMSIVAAGGFLLGFAPPSIVRAAWRHHGEQEAFATAQRAMVAQSTDEVIGVMLPAVRAVTGALAVTLYGPDGYVADSHELAPEHEARRTAGALDERRVPVGDYVLELVLDQSVPLFGEDDLDALNRVTTVGAMAFERTRSLANERALRRELELANDDLQAFVNSTSHDMKNPLFAIRGFVDVLLAERAGPLTDEANHYLERVRANVDFMDQLILDLLELSRVGKVEEERTKVDVGVLLDQLAEGIRERAPEFRVEHADLPAVWMNAGRAQQVFANLLENASRYGGRPDVTVRVTGTVLDGHVDFTVCDDGAGIPPEGRTEIFKPFTRLVGKDQPGTGLGLAICRRIVEACGGSIELLDPHRSVCPGAAFRVVLPRPPREIAQDGEHPDDDQRPMASDGTNGLFSTNDLVGS